MKEKIKNCGKKILKFTKKHKFSCACFLLAVVMTLSGTLSLAKYVSGNPLKETPTAAGLHNNAKIDNVSALSFTNMAFWGGLEDIGVSMNSLRNVTVSVNNYETVNGKQLVTGVTTEYSLIFELPQNFASELALQLVDGKDTALTSQFVLSEFLNSVTPSKPNAVVKTQDPKYNGKKYTGINKDGDIVSYMTVDVSYNASNGSYTIVSQDRDGTVITIEPFIKEDMEQTLYFRLWDVEEKGLENVELESGTLLPPLVLTFKEDVPCYRITVRRPDFRLGAGDPETDTYKLSLAPIDALRDTHLGGYLMSEDESGNMFYAKSLRAGEEVFLSTVTEVVTSNDGSDEQVTLMGSIPVHIVGKEETKELGVSYRETTYKRALVETNTTESATTDSAHTKYYTYRSSSKRWSDSNSNSGLYRIENYLKTTVTTETIYEIRVRETTEAFEKITTKVVSADGTHVEQSVEKTMSTTRVLIEALKRETVTTTYSEYYKFYERKNTGSSWGNAKDSFSVNFTGSYPQSYEMENPPVYESDDVPLSHEEIDELANKKAIKDTYLKNEETKTSFKREKNYTSGVQSIIPTSLYTADPTISLEPLNTHITTPSGVIHKYYLSTSYSKNYPFFVKVHFEQVAQ